MCFITLPALMVTMVVALAELTYAAVASSPYLFAAGAIAVAGTAVSTSLGAYASYQQGQTQKDMYKYQAQINEQNAHIAQQQAENASQVGESEKLELRKKVSLMKGQGRASYASSNVVLGEGSELDWETDLAVKEQYDLDKIDYNTRIKRWQYGVESHNYQAQGAMNEAAGKNAAAAGTMGMVTSIVGGASKMGSTAMSFA